MNKIIKWSYVFVTIVIITPSFLAHALDTLILSPEEQTEFNNLSIEDHILKFDPEVNGVKVQPATFQYAIDKSDEVDLSLNDITINSKTVQLYIGTLSEVIIKPIEQLQIPPQSKVLLFIAPKGILTANGQIEVLEESGNIVWTSSVDKNLLFQGSQVSSNLNPELIDLNGSEFKGDNLETENFFLAELPSSAKIANLDANNKIDLNICFYQKLEDLKSKFCTPRFKYSQKRKTFKIQAANKFSKAFLNNQEIENSGLLTFEADQQINFFAITKNGFSYDLNTKVTGLHLVDYIGSASGRYIYFFGHSNTPIHSQTRFFPHIPSDTWGIRSFWKATIGDTKDYWIAPVAKNNLRIALAGSNGGVFNYPIIVGKVPSITSRIELDNLTAQDSTYSSNPKLLGKTSKDITVSAATLSQDSILISEGTFAQTEFEWNLSLPEKGKDYRAEIYIVPQDLSATYSIYRGFDNEFSLRLVGTVSSDLKFRFFPELSYNHWFENLLGSNSYYFSRQRWGFAIKQSSPLVNYVPPNSKVSALNLKLMTLDIKYRFSPGIWERDECWGAILGIEEANLNGKQGIFFGPGVFWARSMPRIFDMMINWLPFMNYPKWVDMELLYYIKSNSNDFKTGPSPNLAVNFHGKVLWTKELFGEAGFGIKTYDYRMTKKDLVYRAIYATIGMGLNF